ncbi:Por secretion system C-terminal sorting domain-containing protein [Paenimyroides ummariense]|uniref:Por secretion system C-terminal sorting domain-containing protein n=1 Tax=Paenimyroides ummariense TaxID=913024 RepID=A0A1I5CG84_9FLAO|nr:T9SS type A sorting domain-containing protein [Paenimyroides ummariense]SFN85936.1 Por secretion system C-terminal sorting domain-containing protein [Paenimyroides ummariense]
MKKTTFLAFTALLLFNSINAQVLLNDNFDNYTLGNLGTDPNGIIPGQGGWLTSTNNTAIPNNNSTTITNEPFRGKALTLTNTKDKYISVKKELNSLIDQHTNGNNVIKFEIDYYTGSQYYTASAPNTTPHTFITFTTNHKSLFTLAHHVRSQEAYIYALYPESDSKHNEIKLGNGTLGDQLPVNTWVTFIVYLDYNNKKIYFETPYFNKVTVGDFLSKSTSTNLIDDFKPTSVHLSSTANIINASQMDHKYDNIKITRLKTVPTNIIALSINEQLAQSFNLYPNPATNVINITNSENISVKQVEIYDITGKLINSQNFNNETEIQLNIENLTSGTYLLHLHTNEGVAVKKMIKK